jgi:hypothetical protein
MTPLPVCPHCNHPLIRNESMVTGRVTLACRGCKVFRIDGIDQWVQGGAGLYERLVATIPVVKRRTRRFEEMDLDWTDPDWK